ncbi:response regulator [Frigidibacter sp. MR17.24]|uniref:response regulator n=1 Tax=Frigidibacter sp. MR17.24 TaxID=3127345 RepID=UPI003012AA46
MTTDGRQGDDGIDVVWPGGDSESARRIRALDWSGTSLGAIADWSAQLRSTVDTMVHSPIPKVLMWGPDHTMVYNDGYIAIAGSYHPRALGGTVPGIWPEIWDWNRRILQEGFKGRALSYRDQTMVLNRYGAPEEVTFDLFYTPIHESDGTVGGVMCTVLETTAKTAAERAVLRSNQRFRSAIDAVQGVLWTNDGDGRMTGEQPGWAALTGQSLAEYEGYGWSRAVHPDDQAATVEAWQHSVDTQTTFIHEHRVRRHDGAWRTFSIRAVPAIGPDGVVEEWVGVHTDITEQREAERLILTHAHRLEEQVAQRLRAEAQLRQLNETLETRVTAEIEARRRVEAALAQAQKLETIGKLTGGVAHDFNNLLQVVAGNLQLLSREVAGNDRAEMRITNAMAGVARGAKLAAQLLAFGRRQALEPKVVNVARFVRAMDDLLRRAIGEAVEVEVITGGGLWNTFIDPTQIENALLNLAINARDAMEGAGKLTIEMGNASLDDSYARAEPDVTPGQYVMIAVTDTGCGMEDETLARAYEPFFSTKPEGKGSGLGLSMVYGFVKQSGGHVKIYSEPGHGTTVRLYLPRSAEAEDIEVVAPRELAEGGNETILVVEDDEGVRDTVVDLLRDLGYRVLKAVDAQSGLAVIESGAAIDLLFTDVVMPGPLKSPEMARKARERLPGLTVVFTSGYTENSIVHAGRLDNGVDLLSKPYTREDLARKLRSALAANRRAAAPVVTQVAPPPAGVTAAGIAGPPLRILLVEDDLLIRLDMAETLRDHGHEVVEAGTAADAVALFRSTPVDVLLTDHGLPDRTGLALATELRALAPDLAVAFASGDAVAADRAVTLVKPYGERELLDAVARAVALVRPPA